MVRLFEELKKSIRGDLYSDALRRYLHSTDGSIFKVMPLCVIYPKDREDVVKAVEFAAKHGLSIHSRGAGSGLCGSAIGAGIVVDFSKYMNRMLTLNTDEKWFECQPGFRMGELEVALEKTGLFFPPDPSSGEYATFGGMYGTNASGAHSVKYGNVGDYCLDAEVVTADGVIVFSDVMGQGADLTHSLYTLHDLYLSHTDRIETGYPPVRYNTTGYNLRGLVENGRLDLRRLFAGSEGTLGVITRLKFRLIEKPSHDSLVVAFFNDIVSSARAVQEILPMDPCGIEIMDKSLLKLARENEPSLRDKIPADIDNVLLIGFDSNSEKICFERADSVTRLLLEKGYSRDVHLAVSVEEKSKFWAVRKAAVPILYKLKGEKKILALIEDAAVPTDRLVEYFEGIYGILNRLDVSFVVYGHIAKGLMHTRPLLNLKNKADIDLLKTIADEVFGLINSLGGAISGEHGDGRLRSPYIKGQYPDLFELFVRAKEILDPNGIFNPDIITASSEDQMAQSLRYGSDYRGVKKTESLLNWEGGFEPEVERCHGCSKCTTVTRATRMCPVYKFTRDEAAAPKAKANLLRALISGAIPEKSAYEKAFVHVIDHCINCGSCHRECPSGVNIPKMAMEAKACYVKKFGPGLLSRVLTGAEPAGRIAGRVSSLVTPVLENRSVRAAGEKFLGISSRRAGMTFAPKPLGHGVGVKARSGAIRVLYFAGCYASYIRPDTGLATIRALKALGMDVLVPDQHCCGLPMLSKGMTHGAIKCMEKNLSKWGTLLETVDHVVVSCSSCGLSLTTKWGYLLPRHKVSMLEEKTIHVTRLMADNMDRLHPMESHMKVAYHTPCHLKVQPDNGSSIEMLGKIPGLDLHNLNCHCCGMAGSWGMIAKNYDLSRKIGADLIHQLNDSEASFGVTDCPTCTMQMEDLGNKPVFHPMEILVRHLG